MSLFLKEPEYVFGCLGFIAAPPLRRGILGLGLGLSVLAAVLAPALFLFRNTSPVLIGQMMFLVACAWIFVFGLFRLFFTGFMWIAEHIFDLFENAIPGLAVPLDYLRLAYWHFFEVFVTIAFLCLLGSSLLLPFGMVPPL